MIINRAILHIFDFISDVSVFSQLEMDLTRADVCDFLERHIEKTFGDPAGKRGRFMTNSFYENQLRGYIDKNQSFIEFSNKVGHRLRDKIALTDDAERADLLMIEFSDAEGRRYMGLFVLGSRIAFTHRVESTPAEEYEEDDDIEQGGIEEPAAAGEAAKKDVIHNEIIRHYSILPGASQKIESFAITDLEEMTVRFVDKKRTVDGDETYVFPESVLQCDSSISEKEAVRLVQKITMEVAEEYGANPAVAVTRAKSFIADNGERSEHLVTKELGEDVFSESAPMKEAFMERVKDSKLPNDVVIDKTFAAKTGRRHKIKTDTGIEITIPAECFDSSDFIEFINNPDGTISIEIKNVWKIKNK